MAKRIYVGGLSYDTSSDELRSVFEAIGPVVSADVATDRDTGRSRGFGFVEMQEEADATAAIQKLDGTELGGRSLTVNEAKPRADRGAGGGGSRGGYGGGGGGGSRGGYGGGGGGGSRGGGGGRW